MRLFPDKGEYVGANDLTQLVTEALAEAERVGLSTADGEEMLGLLYYALGHGCMHDPYYPSITKALDTSQPTSPEERAARLKRVARELALRELKRVLPN